MSAKTKFFFCGKCGFKNHPRLNQDPTKCEQCGASSDEPEAVDYDPARSA
jgi:ribosomal protein L37AE/L43A